MNKIYEALKSVLPAEQLQEVAAAVEEYLAEANAEMEQAFNARLQEAYATVEAEKSQSEEVAYEGYKQAYSMLADQMLRNESMREEFEQQLERGYEEAYQVWQAEKQKGQNQEVEIYKEFSDKMAQVRDFMIDQLDLYLQNETATIYESALRDIENDPSIAEHKVALDKIMEVTAHFASHEQFANATSSRLADAQKKLDEVQGHMRVLEAKNVRLNSQNCKLNEEVRQFKGLLTESARTEKKERTKTAGNVGGRGVRSYGQGEQILREQSGRQASREEDNDLVTEGDEIHDEMMVLAGLVERD